MKTPWFCLLMLGAGLVVNSRAAGPLLLDLTDPRGGAHPSAHVIRSREARLNAAALPSSNARGALTRLNLFQDTVLTAEWLRFERHAAQNRAWFGRLLNDPLSAVTLTIVEDVQLLEILSPRFGHFEIQSRPDGSCLVRQWDTEKLKGNGNCFHSDLAPAVEGSSDGPGIAEGAGVTAYTIDVLMVYTTRAMDLAGGRSAIVAKAQAAVNGENGNFSRSDISHRMRLVQTREVGHTASGNLSTELSWVAGNSTVASVRDTAGADLVAFISDKDDYGTLGIAQQLGSTSGNSSVAFSANYYDTVAGVWPHEAGHNLGSQHNSAGVYSYSSGHYWDDSGTTRGSMMSYIGTRIPYFSNPGILYSGHATGTDTRDNARSIDNVGDVIAGYRAAKTLIEPSCTISTSTNKPTEGVTFTVSISSLNGGPSTATACKITASIPAGLTLVSHNGGTNFNTGTKVWDVPDMGDGVKKTLVLTLKPNSGSAGASLSVAATLSSIGSGFVDYNLYNNDDTVSVVPVVDPAAPPLPPEGLTASPGPGQVSLRWEPLANTSYYTIRRSATAGGPYFVLANSVTNLHYLDRGLLNGTTWFYVVAGVNPNGTGANSAEASATPGSWGEPVADSFVRDGTYAGDNYGADAGLSAKVSSVDFNREIFLRFDVSGMEQMDQIRVRLTPSSVGADGATTTLAFVPVTSSAWSESLLTWNNRPTAYGAVLTNLTGFQAQQPVEVDVTTLARSRASLDGLMSIRVYSTVSGADRIVTFGSREAAAPADHPKLVYSQPVPRMSAQAAAGQFSIVWPSSGAGFGLYSSSNLNSPVIWAPVTTPPTLQDGSFRVTLPSEPGSRFFRLSSP